MMDATFASSQASAGLGWFGLLLWVGPFLALMIWLQLAQLKFFRLYREIYGVDLLPWAREPWRAPVDGIPAGLRGTKVLFQRQENPSLEKQRRQAVRILIFMVAYMFFGALFPIAFSYVGN